MWRLLHRWFGWHYVAISFGTYRELPAIKRVVRDGIGRPCFWHGGDIVALEDARGLHYNVTMLTPPDDGERKALGLK